MLNKSAACLAIFLLFATFLLGSQEKPDGNSDTEDLVKKTMAMDIAESDYQALLVWVKKLGLPDSGNAQELRNRLYVYYDVSPQSGGGNQTEAPSRIITISSADSTEYISTKDEGDSMIRFLGRVNITVDDSKSAETLNLQADSVIINRSANMINARGKVKLERKKPDGSLDYFLGEALQLDLDNLGGIFLEGESRRSQQSQQNKAVFFRADEILKLGSDVMVFSDALVSSCEEEHPHYSIRAGKMWILGNNEWAMKDVTLFVGEVPAMYLPFFYYPGEEIVFNPVFGFEQRFGYYVQTTTYLLGSKESKENTISLLKIAETEKSYEKRLEGVFLRTTKNVQQKKSADFVKILADLYSNLGLSIAAEAKLSDKGAFSSANAFLGLGFSRSVFNAYSNGLSYYSPLISEGAYKSIWHSGSLLGYELPFRFGFNLGSTIKLGALNLSFNLPFYSDPYYNRDFMNRSEHMDWLQFMNPQKEEKSIGLINNFTNSINLSAVLGSQHLPSFLPWISSISLSRFKSELYWTSARRPLPVSAAEKLLFSANPGSDFFIPSDWTILDANASISGTLFKYPSEKAHKKAAADGNRAAESHAMGSTLEEKGWLAAAAMENSEPLAPWKPSKEEKREAAERVQDSIPDFSAPIILSAEKATDRKVLNLALAYSYSPSLNWKLKLMDMLWKEPEDIDWSVFYETISMRNSGNLNFSANIYEGILGINAAFNANNQFMERPRQSDDHTVLTTALQETLAKQDAQYRNDKISGSLSINSSPFQDAWLFAPSNISYKISSLIYEYAFENMDPGHLDKPEKAIYKTSFAEWSDKAISSHYLSVGLAARPWGYDQNLSLSANLPPLPENYSMKLALKYPFGNLTVQSAYGTQKNESAFAWSPINISLGLGESPWPIMKTAFIWDIENEKAKSLSLSLSWGGFYMSANAIEAQAYKIKENLGWEPRGDAGFQFANFDLGYKNSIKPAALWKNRYYWQLDVEAFAQQSLLRFTESSLDFKTALTVNVHELLDLSFSSVSRNSSLWRYYPWLFGVPDYIKPVDPVFDLLESFNFFDLSGEARRRSLFKLKTLTFSAIHKLHDWDLSLSYSLSPVLVNDIAAEKKYEFKSSFSLSLAWRDISQIKASYRQESVGSDVKASGWD